MSTPCPCEDGDDSFQFQMLGRTDDNISQTRPPHLYGDDSPWSGHDILQNQTTPRPAWQRTATPNSSLNRFQAIAGGTHEDLHQTRPPLEMSMLAATPPGRNLHRQAVTRCLALQQSRGHASADSTSDSFNRFQMLGRTHEDLHQTSQPFLHGSGSDWEDSHDSFNRFQALGDRTHEGLNQIGTPSWNSSRIDSTIDSLNRFQTLANRTGESLHQTRPPAFDHSSMDSTIDSLNRFQTLANRTGESLHQTRPPAFDHSGMDSTHDSFNRFQMIAERSHEGISGTRPPLMDHSSMEANVGSCACEDEDSLNRFRMVGHHDQHHISQVQSPSFLGDSSGYDTTADSFDLLGMLAGRAHDNIHQTSPPMNMVMPSPPHQHSPAGASSYEFEDSLNSFRSVGQHDHGQHISQIHPPSFLGDSSAHDYTADSLDLFRMIGNRTHDSLLQTRPPLDMSISTPHHTPPRGSSTPTSPCTPRHQIGRPAPPRPFVLMPTQIPLPTEAGPVRPRAAGGCRARPSQVRFHPPSPSHVAGPSRLLPSLPPAPFNSPRQPRAPHHQRPSCTCHEARRSGGRHPDLHARPSRSRLPRLDPRYVATPHPRTPSAPPLGRAGRDLHLGVHPSRSASAIPRRIPQQHPAAAPPSAHHLVELERSGHVHRLGVEVAPHPEMYGNVRPLNLDVTPADAAPFATPPNYGSIPHAVRGRHRQQRRHIPPNAMTARQRLNFPCDICAEAVERMSNVSNDGGPGRRPRSHQATPRPRGCPNRSLP